MGNCSFVKTPDEIEYYLSTRANPSWMHDCEGMFVTWATDPEALKAALPAPLQMVAPVVTSYVIEVHDPTFCTSYFESAILTPVTDGKEVGLYPFEMLLTGGDNAVFEGREGMGIPKKTADKIDLRRLGDKAYASVERMGVKVFDVECDLGEYDSPMAAQIFGDIKEGTVNDGNEYFYKYGTSFNEKGAPVFANVFLIKVLGRMAYKSWEKMSVKVNLQPSVNDPWASLPVVQSLGGGWTKLDIGLLKFLGLTPMGDQANDIVPKLLVGKYDSSIFGQPNRIF